MEQVPPRAPRLTDERLVFVYGTLLRGERNHGLMTGARFLRPALTRAQFDLHDLGPFPGMVAGGATQIDGELYAVSPQGVHNLDELEDHPEYFRRSTIQLEDGTRVESYLLPEAHGSPYPRIACGSWRRREGLRRVD